MKIVMLVGIGSFIGGIFRYLLSDFVQTKFLFSFPTGTILVNILGSFLIGVIFGLSERGNISMETRLFLATGILGGFTTFSAFSNETVQMMRDGQFIISSGYVLSSVIFSLLATFIGLSIVKLF